MAVKWVKEGVLFLNDYSESITETIYFRTGDFVAGTATYSGDGFLRSDMGDALINSTLLL